jgi:hypothetical protein|tara:strand:+ start:1876 stop:2136 length:261 start_codon:yes stop_codon:yes gene_type:complete
MDIKNKRKLILEAAENSINELIKVMNKKIDIDDVDPEKVKISASAYRLAMEDAITLLQKVEEMTNALNEQPTSPKESFYGVENRIQ